MNRTEDDKYSPPFEVTSVILNLVAEIAENVGRLDVGGDFASDLPLRRINRIKTIQGSLAIEGNTLSESQITAIIASREYSTPTPAGILSGDQRCVGSSYGDTFCGVHAHRNS